MLAQHISWSTAHVVDVKVMNSKTRDVVKKKTNSFDPSTKTLSRILRSIQDTGPKEKTTLSVDTNLNYKRLAKHIVWMEAKGLVESTIVKSRIKIDLTEKGREFTTVFFND